MRLILTLIEESLDLSPILASTELHMNMTLLYWKWSRQSHFRYVFFLNFQYSPSLPILNYKMDNYKYFPFSQTSSLFVYRNLTQISLEKLEVWLVGDDGPSMDKFHQFWEKFIFQLFQIINVCKCTDYQDRMRYILFAINHHSHLNSNTLMIFKHMINITWFTYAFSGFQEYFCVLELQMEEKTLAKVTLEAHWFSKVLVLKLYLRLVSGKNIIWNDNDTCIIRFYFQVEMVDFN